MLGTVVEYMRTVVNCKMPRTNCDYNYLESAMLNELSLRQKRKTIFEYGESRYHIRTLSLYNPQNMRDQIP